ncbi:MAG: V-type ATP synthase subunit E [Methanolinea sp.]
MSVEQIEQRILSDARAEAERTRERAGMEAERILARARAEAERQARDILASGREETARMCAQLLSQSRIEARRILRSAREKAIDGALAGARGRLSRVRESPEYPRIFSRLAAEGIALLGQGEAVLEFHPADRPLAESFAKENAGGPVRCRLSDRPLATAGGVVVRRPDGTVSVNNTVEARFERMRGEIAAGVARILFGDGGVKA